MGRKRRRERERFFIFSTFVIFQSATKQFIRSYKIFSANKVLINFICILVASYKTLKMASNTKYKFEWKDLGDIDLGRPNLGVNTNVLVYRLMQYTMRDVLEKHWGAEKTNDFFIEAGYKAGTEFCNNVLNCTLDFDGFVADLSDNLEKYGIGILRIE